MGIDIRDGQQLECITCALCIDACDNVMAKIGRPRGLIDYDTLNNHDRRQRGEPTRLQLVRPRTVLYAGLILAVGVVMLVSLVTRATLDVNVQHDRNPLYVRLADGSIRNGYTVKILNKDYTPARFRLAVDGLPQAKISIVGREPGVVGDLPVPADGLAGFRVYIAVPPSALTGATQPIDIRVVEQEGDRSASSPSIFRGPEG